MNDGILLPEPDAGRVDAYVALFTGIWKQMQQGFHPQHEHNMQAAVNSWLHLADENKLAVWARLSEHARERLDEIKFYHKWLVPGLLDVFRVPMGEAGIGVTPKKIIMWNDPVYSGPPK